MIVVMSGSMSVGKTTVANRLAVKHGFKTELAFADHLKHLITKFYDVDRRALYAPMKTPKIREQLQKTADLIKFLKGDRYFTEYLLTNLEHHLSLGEDVIVSDARYLSELVALEEWGANIVRIERPGLDISGKLHQHESERSAWCYWEKRRKANTDCVIINDSTISSLHQKVDDWVESISA